MTRSALAGLACLLALLGGCATPGRTFDTPESAATALIESLQPLDDAKVRTVLGSEGITLLRTDDAQADQAMVDRFVEAFRAQHELVEVDPSTVIIETGPDGWPMPIPLVRSGNGWRFDTAAGADEINNRRVGRNELDVFHACLAIVDAQREYAAHGYGGEPGVFAARLVSEPGTRNGLFWPTSEGESPSPLGPFLAEAGVEPLAAGSPPRRSFAGYTFRLLKSQGSFAPGGAMNFLQEGRLVNGFGVIATPVKYGETGVMTFIVSQTGVVYERDFGSQTASKAAAVHSFDPTPEWSIVPHDWE